MPDAPEFSRRARLRNLAQTTWTLAAGRICGAAIGAMAGWYGALAGFAMGAMLDAARRRRQRPESLEAETVADPEQASAGYGLSKLEPSKAVLLRAADMLGVSVEADRAAIKRAFWRISRASHPDGPDPDPERFMAAKQAAEALLGRPD